MKAIVKTVSFDVISLDLLKIKRTRQDGIKTGLTDALQLVCCCFFKNFHFSSRNISILVNIGIVGLIPVKYT